MLFHVILILLIGICGLLMRSGIALKVYFTVSLLILTILSAFRSLNIGNDSFDYALSFVRIGEYPGIFDNTSRYEIGYIILNKFLYYFSKDPFILFFLSSVFVTGTIFWFISKYSKSVWMSIFLFLNLRIYYFTLSGIRQSIALSIVLISFHFLHKNKKLPFILLVILASTFHSSAILFLIVYPLSKIKYTKKVMMVYLLVALLLYSTFNSFMNIVFSIFPQYLVYNGSDYFENTQVASVLDSLIVLLILFVGAFIFWKSAKKSYFFNVMLHIISIATVITLVSINASIIKRAALYFFTFSIVYIPLILNEINHKQKRLLLSYLFIVLFFAYNLIVLYYRPEWQHVYPYEFQ